MNVQVDVYTRTSHWWHTGCPDIPGVSEIGEPTIMKHRPVVDPIFGEWLSIFDPVLNQDALAPPNLPSKFGRRNFGRHITSHQACRFAFAGDII